jgi:hypothetical protein
MGYLQVGEAKTAQRQTLKCHPAISTLGEHDYCHIISTRTLSAATDLVWRISGGILGDRIGRVRRHVLEDSAQPLDDVIIFNPTARHPRCVALAGVLVAEGVASH